MHTYARPKVVGGTLFEKFRVGGVIKISEFVSLICDKLALKI